MTPFPVFPSFSTFTGNETLNVLLELEPMPTVARFYYIDINGSHVLVLEDNSPELILYGPSLVYLFTIMWDTADLLDRDVAVYVNITNTLGFSELSSAIPVHLRNVPVPTIQSVGAYAGGALAGKTLNGSVPIVVTTPYYATATEFYLIYSNGTSVPMVGSIFASGDNKTFNFFWNSWVNYDGYFVRIEARMYSRGGWSNLNIGPAVYSSTFNLVNIPQPALQTTFIPSYNYFGNITITAYTPLNASSATFYYHNSTGDFEVNGNGVVLASSTPDNKTFQIAWYTDLLNEMDGVHVYVIMSSLGGFTNRSSNSNTFNLCNVPDPMFEQVSEVIPGVISGSPITIVVNSTRFAQNVTMYAVLDSTLYSIGFQNVIEISPTYFTATFTWDSVNFTQFVLSNIDGSRYDFDVYFHVDMRNAANRPGTINSSTFHVYNAPSLLENLPAEVHGELT
nr:hypothetical protein [Candidatus Sigynarchaeota archaeon]